VCGFLAPTPELPRKPGEWRTFDITLLGRTLTVVQDGQTIIDHKEIPGITGGALDSHEGLPGPSIFRVARRGGWLSAALLLRPRRNEFQKIWI